MNNLVENQYGHGAIDSKIDFRDHTPKGLGMATTLFDWEHGIDLENLLDRKIPVKNQFSSFSCFPFNALVLMEDLTYKLISQITKGDIVFSHNGNKNKVINVFQRKWQGTTKIVSLYGDYRKIESTKEHPFWAVKRPPHPKYFELKMFDKLSPDFYKIGDLVKGDWIGLPLNNHVKDNTLHEYEKDSDFLWLLGLYLAEGCTNKKGGVAFSVHQDEFEWYEKIKRIMSKYGASVSFFFKKTDKGLSIRIGSIKWAEIFDELGGRYCDKKRISSRLMTLEPSLQMNIVRGYQEGDGHFRRNGWTIKGTSYELLTQIRTILLRNGIYSSFCKEKKYEKKKQAYSLSYQLTKNRYSILKDNFIYAQIKSIEHKNAFTGYSVYNLEVENDNSYQVNGIAVHNCGGQSASYYLEVLEYLRTHTFDELSAKYIYSQIFYPNGGTTIRDIGKLVVRKGDCLESLCPSQQNNNCTEPFMRDRSNITPAVDLNASPQREFGFAFPKLDIDSIAQAIAVNKGCIIQCDGENNGTWNSVYPQPPKNKVWSHFLFALKAKLINGKKFIGIINSWGNVGDAGTQWLGEEYFTSGNVTNALVFYDKTIYPTYNAPPTQKVLSWLQSFLQWFSLYY